jgi:parvulin-like peptidyl-prolyl isomerase
MTFRAKPVDRRSRSSRDLSGRRNLLMNLGFGLVVLAALAILALGAGATWYNDHNGAVATVNGSTISRDQYRTRFRIEQWRLDQAESRIRDEYSAGRITAAERDSNINLISQQKQALPALTQQRLVDAELQRQLAPTHGVEITSGEVDERLVAEASRKELRHSWLIEVEPQISTDADEPTAEQTAEAKAKAEAALEDLRDGEDWVEVAKAASTAASASRGGEVGWLTEDVSLDEGFRTALFAAELDVPTEVIEGDDGTFRIGRVTEIVAASTDPAFEQKLADASIPVAEYRSVVESDLRRERLAEAVALSVIDAETAQRRVSRIIVDEPTGAGDEIKVSHILYSPNDIVDQTELGALAEDDPAWEAARIEAQAAYDKLAALADSDDLATEFATLAKAESDEPGADTSGGELPFFTRDAVDRGFGDAIFAAGLEPGDLLEPVRSQFGWHVILFEERRGDPESRISAAKIEADGGGDFAEIAERVSDAADAEDGGELGWIARHQLERLLEDAIFAAPVGGTTDVIRIPDEGFALYKVWEEQVRAPDEDQAAILETDAFSNWYTAEKDAATIDTAFDLPSDV